MIASSHSSSGTDFRERMQREIAKLNQLAEISRRYDLDPIRESIKDRIRDSSWGLMLFVVGNGKFGKSSLINALVGRQVAPVDDVSKTFKVDVFTAADGDDEHALVRSVQHEVAERVSIKEAEELCANEEKLIEDALKADKDHQSTIADVVWRYSDLWIGNGLCLVDTPGFDQLLLKGDLKAERLVRGLGATYQADAIWDFWYHRADRVLWCFQANKLEASETKKTLETLLELFKIPIVAVVTRSDLLKETPWSELVQRFHKIYGPLLQRQGDIRLFRTVCGGPSFQPPGEGVEALRSHLLELAHDWHTTKSLSMADRLVELTDKVDRTLKSSARQMIENLRIIAFTADEIAQEATRLVEAAVPVAQQQVVNHFETKIEGLDAELASIYHKLAPTTFSSQEKIQEAGEPLLRAYLDEDSLNSQLNAQLNRVGKEIRKFATAKSNTKKLGRARINSSLKVEVEEFQFRMHVPDSDINTRATLPPIKLPGCPLTAASFLLFVLASIASFMYLIHQ